MPALLVHGVPSTPRMWDALRTHLKRDDIVTPALPGFGSPVPAGFDCSKEAYAGWLIGEIERQAAPVDLVGHDWGAILVVRVAALRPDLVRTWAMGDAPVDREYVWHRVAQLWQTPGRGEEVMAMIDAERLTATLVSEGVPKEAARAEAAVLDDPMKAAILCLYRSAVDVGAQWGDELPRGEGRGLVFWGEDDPYAGVAFGERLAARTGARFLRVAGAGHWLPYQSPEPLARALTELWA